jgi:predicted GTPase
VIADALRPGHELAYHPGEANARMADAFVITKVDEAPPGDVQTVRANLATLNPQASQTEAVLRVAVDDAAVLRGKRALVIEDGPTVTHGGMATGAGWRAAQRFGAQVIDPRPWAVGSIRAAFEAYPHLGPVLPALGYGAEQLGELSATVSAVPCDVVVVASPVDLRRLLDFTRPSLRVTYELEVVGGRPLEDILAGIEQP